MGIIKGSERIHRRFVRLGCKAWSCPICGPRKLKRYRYSIGRIAQERKLDRFLTLTLDPSKCDIEVSVKHIRNSWNKFRIYFKRKYKVTLTFITVVEFHKSGYAHMHILLDRYIPQSWISISWEAIGGGKIVFIKKIDQHRIASYMTKYLTKAMYDPTAESHIRHLFRRVTTSRDIKLFARKPGGEWVLMTVSIEYLFSELSSLITDVNCDIDGVMHSFEISIN